MEQMHYHRVVKEEEEQKQLQDGALKERQSLQHGNDHNIIATVVVPSFSSAPTNNAVFSASVAEQPLLQKEEVLHNHTLKEKQKEQPAQRIEETTNVAENDNNINHNSEAVGLGVIAEFVENAIINGEAISSATINDAASQNQNSVYFDKQQGFDIRVENLDIEHSPFNEVINNQCMETVVDKVPSGSELLLPLPNSSEIQAATVENCGDEINAKAYPNLTEEIYQQLEEFDVEAVLAKQETHDLFCPNCKSCITKRVILRKRKRSIPIPNFDTKAKRDKVNSYIDETNQAGHVIATPNGRAEPPADNYEPEREPEVFRCLSCFRFFIPMRNGLKLFPSFGGTLEPETSQKPSLIPSSSLENPSIVVAASNEKNNWFLALFTSNKGRKASAQGEASIEDSKTHPIEQLQSSSSFNNVQTFPGIDNSESPLVDTPINQNVNLTPDIKPGLGGANSSIPSIVKSVIKTESWIGKSKKSGVALQNEPLVDQNDSLQKVRGDFSVTEKLQTENVRTNAGEENWDSVDVIKTDISEPDSILVATVATTEILFNAGKPAKDVILKVYEGYPTPIFEKSQKDVDKTPEITQDSSCSLMEEAQSPDQSFGSAVVANDVASDKQSSSVDATILSFQDFKKVQKDVEEEINPSVAKEKKEAFKTSTSPIADNVPIEGAIVTETQTQIYIGEQPRAEVGEHQEWEILKSIVYGGLVESITSLGVVSSAAASGTAPLNVLALGLANLIGGIFVIGHNLIDLKNNHSGGDSQQMNVQDRYQELLGRRENFLLHAVVAVLSFLIFGSVPLVIYGLLISKNYYAEVKIAVVAATSVACIILLAIGKAYNTRPPKSYVKMVLYYVTIILATSGISYIVGDLVKDLLEKISGSESGYVLTMPSPDTRRMKPAWMSY